MQNDTGDAIQKATRVFVNIAGLAITIVGLSGVPGDLQTWKAKQNALENHVDAILARLAFFEKRQRGEVCDDDESVGRV